MSLSRATVPLMTLLLFCTTSVVAQEQKKTDPALLTLDRIFASDDFDADAYGSVQWMNVLGGYTKTAKSKSMPGYQDIIRVDPATGKNEILVDARLLIPSGSTSPIRIEDFQWSDDEALILIFTNSRRVWRRNTRGDYWVYDLTARELRRLGRDMPPSTMMFAQFSPDGHRVAYVHERNIYVENLDTGTVTQLTKTDSENVINGTFDWVYEEEFGLHSGFRWSPDSKRIAYWQLDTTGVGNYFLLSNAEGLYQRLKRFAYPKVGSANSAYKIGVVNIDGPAKTVWLKTPGDSRNTYIAQMNWTKNNNEILLQHLNRLQNTNTVLLADATTGTTRTLFEERDDAWVEVYDFLEWVDAGSKFTWLSSRTGWRHLYLVSAKTGVAEPVTKGTYDVIEPVHIDGKAGWFYYLASPDNATQTYLYRAKLDGSSHEKLTPADQPGMHHYQISPDGAFAIHSWSSFDSPPVTNLVSLPDHKEVRMLEANNEAHKAVAKLKRTPTEFFKVDIGDGVELDGWCMKPPDFDAKKKYPLLFYVYGEPAGQTVLDSWSSTRYLWHLLLAQKGYLVMSVDNRGTPAPRGRAWRKQVYRKVGITAPQDQAAAAKAIVKKWDFVDADRIGIWGWSGGGSMSLHAIFRFPKLYKMAMSIAPVSNERYYDTIYQERYMGLPRDNVKGYRDGSPITYAHQLEGKLLIVHGTADDNVHYGNAEAIFNELIANNKQFEMMAYPNRTHSIREGKNTRRHLFTLLTQYLERNLPAR